MRPHGKTKLGFYPLPVAEAERLRNCLAFPPEFSALDPCVGDGVAFAHLLEGTQARRYGIEIDSHRAEQAASLGIDTLHANTSDVRCPAETLSLLYLNPPYDFETGQTNNQRLELVFLQHTYRWLKPGGVLVFVIPQPQLRPCAKMLSEHFTDLVVYRLTEPASVQYQQVAVLGVRRKRHQHIQDSALLEGVRWLEMLATKADLEALGDAPTSRYEIPDSGPVVLSQCGYSIGCGGRPAARVIGLPPGQPRASPQTTGRSRPAAHAAAWWACRVAVYRWNAQRRVRRRKRSSHRPLAVGEVHRSLGRAGGRRHQDPA